jgi:hypothetical protein
VRENTPCRYYFKHSKEDLDQADLVKRLREQFFDVLIVIDEFGAWLSRITAKGQVGNVAETPSLLNTLWGWRRHASQITAAQASREILALITRPFSSTPISRGSRLCRSHSGGSASASV